MAKQTWKRKWEAGRMRHTRAIQRDRTKRPVVAPPDKETERRLSMLLQPAIEAQAETAKSLGSETPLLSRSRTREAVPEVFTFHRSEPAARVEAPKYSSLLKTVKYPGLDEP